MTHSRTIGEPRVSLNRATQVSYNTVSGVTTAPTVTYVYDSDSTYGITADGMLLRINVGSDYQERYTVDADFRVSSAIRTMGARTYTTSYGYNEASQVKQLTYPSTRIVDVGYDSVGRLNSLVSPPGNGNITYLSNVSYNVAGQPTGGTLGNGVTEVFGYDSNRMQLTSQKAGTASPYTNRMNLTYGYQATSGQMGTGSTAGNAAQLMSVSGTINSTTESASYKYDLLGRLKESEQTSNGASASRYFVYDRWGNRTQVQLDKESDPIQTITLEQSGGVPTNRIASVTSESTVNYTFDAAGNVTNDGVHTYTYDSENRVVGVDGGSTASSAYDHQNRRYKKTVGSAVTHYVWEGSQVLAEHNGSTGAVATEYVYSGSRMIAKVASGSTQYFLSDRLSVRAMLDTSGNVLGRQAHLPFGEDFGESGTQEKHHFTSYERDTESGTDYAVNRQYSQAIGRFNRPDPFRGSCRPTNPQKWNRYSYVIDDPINHVDPSGLDLTETIANLLWWARLAWNQTLGNDPAGRHAPLLDTGMEGFEPGGGQVLFGLGYAQAYKLVGPAYDKSGTKVVGWRYTPTCESYQCGPRGDRIEKEKSGPFLQCAGGTMRIFLPWPMLLCLGVCKGMVTPGHCDIKPWPL